VVEAPVSLLTSATATAIYGSLVAAYFIGTLASWMTT
jgi:hypothetical protein